MKSKVLVMIPTRGRPDEHGVAVRSVLKTSKADVISYIDEDQSHEYSTAVATNFRRDLPLEEYLGGRVRSCIGPRIGPVASVNHIVQMHPEYDVYGMITDDCEITTPGWDKWLMGAVQYFPGRICAVSPYHNHGNHVDMPFVTREWIKTVGWYACPDCYHYAWPIITGLIGEMTALVHAPMQSFAIKHDYEPGTNPGPRQRDAEAFFDYVSLKMPAVVERVRNAMSAGV